jgi:hypothetical protein
MAKVVRVQDGGAVRKRWVKDLVQHPRRWEAVQEAVGLRLIEDPLGCGSFGCVFAADDPQDPWVVKITIDPTEASMWQTILDLSEREGWGEGGFTHIKEIVRLLPDVGEGKKKTKVHAIVREAVAPLLTNDSHTWSNFSRQVVAPTELPEWLSSPHSRPGDLFSVDRPARDLLESAMWIQKYHVAAQFIYAARSPRKKQSYGSFGFSTLEQARAHLQRAIDFLKSGYTWTLGETLEMLWSNEIVLNDLRLANVGWRFLPQFLDENEDNVLVLFDPGYTATGFRTSKPPREAMIANPGFEWYVTEEIAR